jgi:hypothetical protein
MCDAFKAFSCLPQVVVGGCRGCKFLKISLDLIVFESTDELLIKGRTMDNVQNFDSYINIP